jgi:DNA replication protein DnaC
MESNLLLENYLKRLRLPSIARNYVKTAQEASVANLPYERYLLALAEQEVLQRDQNAFALRLKRAGFPIMKSLESFDFSASPGLDKQRILQLAEGHWIDSAEVVILVGNPGVGKSHCAIALGVEACRRGKRARYFSAEGLATAIVEAKAQMLYGKLQRQLERADVVVVDELGYVSLNRESAQALFHFFSERHERRSVIITTNLEFGKWTEVFGEERMTAALLDRLTHKAHIFLATGESYRFRESQQRKHSAKGRASTQRKGYEDVEKS